MRGCAVTGTADQPAIERLNETFALQRQAYLKQPDPPLETRLELLGRIPGMMMSNARRVAEALSSDYGYHSELTAYLFDVLNVVERAQFVATHLPRWLVPEQREMDPHLYGHSRAYIEFQPKGVIGNLSAWNFPVDLSIGPLIEMLAAGNRVIIKPSEQVPAVGELLAEMIGTTFDRDQVSVATGDLDLARHFSTLPWDHLLYTGNTAIGREVMLKAAANLVPVTLELGGKNPTVFTEDAITPENVRTMLGAKLTKNGQLCITVDHCFVPQSQLDRFVGIIRSQIESIMGDYTTSVLGVAVINRRQFDRLQRYVDDAKARNPASVIEIGSPARTTGACRMPLTLVINPAPDALVCQHEVFGPILPIIGYRTIDEVIERIQSAERPLGIYIYSSQPALVERVRRNTASGGFCVNGAALQGAQSSLGFGGVGKSGMGRHHGFEGFREFSNPRGVVELAPDAQIAPIMSPHGDVARQFIRTVTGGLLGD
jgi:coniferyl-aldehyde dehydrogenase